MADSVDAAPDVDVTHLQAELSAVRDAKMRAECMAAIQRDAVQLTLDLLVTHPDLRGFFRMFIKRLVDEVGARSCGVWLLDEATTACDLWMANIGGETLTADSPGWESLDLPREAMARHLETSADSRTLVLDYRGDDRRLPDAVRAFNRGAGIETVITAPLNVGARTMGWMAIATAESSACECLWLGAVLDAASRQASLALFYSRVVEQSLFEARRQAVLEERNRIARDIHDTLAQGFGAILMHLQAAERNAGAQPPLVAKSLETAVHLARTHLVEARRSVAALRPQSEARENVSAALHRLVELAQRTNDVPVDLVLDDLPAFDAGVEQEIVGIAQEALTNAVRHANAKRIVVRAGSVRNVGFRLTVTDDGRGMARDRGAGGFGMTSMRERADRIGAELTFVTAPRAGTEVVLAWEPAAFAIPRALAEAHADDAR
jgi:signal transduction histidine kinase